MLKATRRASFGIGGRLFVAFFAVSILALGSASVAFLGLSFVRDSQQELSGKVYPAVRDAQEVALEATTLVLDLPKLFNSSTHDELQRHTETAQNRRANIVSLIERSRNSDAAITIDARVMELIDDLGRDIEALRRLSATNIKAIADSEQSRALLFKEVDTVLTEGKGTLISLSEQSLEERQLIETQLTSSAGFDAALMLSMFRSFSARGIDDLKYTGDLLLRAESIRDELELIDDVRTPELIDAMQQKLSLHVTAISSAVLRLSDRSIKSNLAKPTADLSRLLSQARNVFTLRREILINQAEIATIRAATQETGEEVKRLVGDFVERAQVVMDQRVVGAKETVSQTQTFVIAVATLIVAAASLIYVFYINNNLVYRINRLLGSTTRLNEGDFTQPVQISENDQITSLEKATEQSRLNAIKLRTTDQQMKSYARDLERSNRDLEQFAYVTSHDLRAPLRGIEALSQWIEEDITTGNHDEVRDNLKRLRGRVSRMDSLLTGILRYSRIGHDRDEIGEIDVEEMVREVFDDHNVDEQFKLVFSSTTKTTEAGLAFFNQIASNLLSNAMKHHDRNDGTITVHFKEDDTQSSLTVSDDGPGIPEAMKSKIFDIFQTLKSRDEFEASGIGLSIIKKLVDQAEGTISVDPSPEGGARFVVSWPRKMNAA